MQFVELRAANPAYPTSNNFTWGFETKRQTDCIWALQLLKWYFFLNQYFRRWIKSLPDNKDIISRWAEKLHRTMEFMYYWREAAVPYRASAAHYASKTWLIRLESSLKAVQKEYWVQPITRKWIVENCFFNSDSGLNSYSYDEVKKELIRYPGSGNVDWEGWRKCGVIRCVCLIIFDKMSAMRKSTALLDYFMHAIVLNVLLRKRHWLLDNQYAMRGVPPICCSA